MNASSDNNYLKRGRGFQSGLFDIRYGESLDFRATWPHIGSLGLCYEGLLRLAYSKEIKSC